MKAQFVAAAAFAALALPYASAQTACQGSALTGTVRDSTQALIPGATLTIDGRTKVTSGPDGKYRFACVADGPHTLTIVEDGFAAKELAVKTPRTLAQDVVLSLNTVQTEIDVSGDETPATSANSSGPTQTISGSRLQALADDPDDLLRELQQLSAAAGGSSANTTIKVDGFQDSSALPPKSSIAYIKVNPDQFSAEYREPPFEGGSVEVYTKPGAKAYHGALFLTNGSSFENARDPFATSKAALGKQRYGFELTGPVRKSGSDFALTLEHRSIDNDAVVDAYLPTGSFNQTVGAPQRLWLGTARLDWQLGAKNTLITTYSANVNHLVNVGVGGNSLVETGYDSEKYEHMFRVSDITTASAHLMHEARLSLSWNGHNYTPVSIAPQIQVSGAFTGGGSSLGAEQVHLLSIEWDDDAIWTTKNHTLKFGSQMNVYDNHRRLPTYFNGSYTFAGGVAPVLDANNNPTSQTESIGGLEQYRRAQLNLAGGTPTAYTSVVGTPAVDFVQVREALFFQDDWKAGHGLEIAYGLRYAFQNDPTMLNTLTPRLGILWSPNKKGTWTLHAHAGMFGGQSGSNPYAEVQREDGVHRVTSLAYNPVNCLGAAASCNPFAGTTPILSRRVYNPHYTNLFWAAENIGGTRTLPQGWNLSVDFYIGRIWNDERTENINSPLNGVATGPRALGIPNQNILQLQNSGQGRVNAIFGGIENHHYKYAQFFFGGVHVVLFDDTNDDELNQPQSAFSNAGELAPRSNQGEWQLFGNSTFNLPRKVQLSFDYQGSGDGHYNITTGSDNNQDGDFNDRPQYALPGTPLCANAPTAVPCAYATRYGLLVASGGGVVLRRNEGVMPWTIYLDANIQRAWKLTRNAKAEHQQTLTVNVRSSNVLNHLNVTSMGGVLGSPEFGLPYAADNGRRVEAGLRYAF